MASFPKQPPFFDAKKLPGGIISHGSGSNLVAAAGLTMMADKPLAPDEIDSVPESWVELAPSRASLCSSIEAVNVESTSGGNASANKDSRLSPVSLQSPHVEFESSLEQVKYRLVKDMVPEAPKSTDWLWDWTNRSDPTSTDKAPRSRNTAQIGSTLTTPPNSPEPENSEFDFKSIKSGGKFPPKRRGKFFNWSVFCRPDVLLAIVITNLFTGAVIYYLTRPKNVVDPFERPIASYYYW